MIAGVHTHFRVHTLSSCKDQLDQIHLCQRLFLQTHKSVNIHFKNLFSIGDFMSFDKLTAVWNVPVTEAGTESRNQSFAYLEEHPESPEMDGWKSSEPWPVCPVSSGASLWHRLILWAPGATHQLSCHPWKADFPQLCLQLGVVPLSHSALVLLYIKQTFLLANWPHLSWLIILDPVRDLCSQLDQIIIAGPFKLELKLFTLF